MLGGQMGQMGGQMGLMGSPYASSALGLGRGLYGSPYGVQSQLLGGGLLNGGMLGGPMNSMGLGSDVQSKAEKDIKKAKKINHEVKKEKATIAGKAAAAAAPAPAAATVTPKVV